MGDHMNSHIVGLVLASAALGACRPENLSIYDLEGRVVMPRDAGEGRLPIADSNGVITDRVLVDEPRMIGPVYIGLYAEIDYTQGFYPAPLLTRGNTPSRADGDAFPYGGTTIGDFRIGCLEELACKLVSGRYKSYEEIVGWWRDTLERPLRDVFQNDITTGEFIQQNCFDLMELTSDEELRIIATEDRNGDGEITNQDLDFVQDANGDWVAEFRIWEAEFYKGFSAWAFMDAPVGQDFTFSTCDDSLGYQELTYTRGFYNGAQQQDVLNVPGTYLGDGDWVSSVPLIWENPQEYVEVVIDFKIGRDDIGPLREAALAAKQQKETP